MWRVSTTGGAACTSVTGTRLLRHDWVLSALGKENAGDDRILAGSVGIFRFSTNAAALAIGPKKFPVETFVRQFASGTSPVDPPIMPQLQDYRCGGVTWCHLCPAKAPAP
jgi:hypothetical protein